MIVDTTILDLLCARYTHSVVLSMAAIPKADTKDWRLRRESRDGELQLLLPFVPSNARVVLDELEKILVDAGNCDGVQICQISHA